MPPRKKQEAKVETAEADESQSPATKDQTTGRAKIAKADKVAAKARASRVAALEEERAMCERVGKPERVAAIDAEIKRSKSQVSDRTDAAPSDEA